MWRGRRSFRLGSPLSWSLPGESDQRWADLVPASHRTLCQQSDERGEETCVLALFLFPMRFTLLLQGEEVVRSWCLPGADVWRSLRSQM